MQSSIASQSNSYASGKQLSSICPVCQIKFWRYKETGVDGDEFCSFECSLKAKNQSNIYFTYWEPEA